MMRPLVLEIRGVRRWLRSLPKLARDRANGETVVEKLDGRRSAEVRSSNNDRNASAKRGYQYFCISVFRCSWFSLVLPGCSVFFVLCDECLRSKKFRYERAFGLGSESIRRENSRIRFACTVFTLGIMNHGHMRRLHAKRQPSVIVRRARWNARVTWNARVAMEP
ncbi:hypothetical protein GA0061078_0861 [Bifidobacterium bohemicum]|uniref:Uncharacterized protein n=1 Tax=Bifidobacterium bohemicum DSM 22767 TaxID=1437606 RepID=A0A086ZEX6_9BIFI|nr:hypothetical protein BBOH_1338 [Bifidobacterium bohemicum DSM 22767]SCB92178.1 hypothetical protein GA0061078_0861 [Bifidobacterium bohemicum]